MLESGAEVSDSGSESDGQAWIPQSQLERGLLIHQQLHGDNHLQFLPAANMDLGGVHAQDHFDFIASHALIRCAAALRRRGSTRTWLYCEGPRSRLWDHSRADLLPCQCVDVFEVSQRLVFGT